MWINSVKSASRLSRSDLKLRHDCSVDAENNAMNSDKIREREDDKTEKVKSPDKVETPTPPQQMDPSKKPEPPEQERSDKKRQ